MKLDSDNYRLYAAKHYNNSACLGEEEFGRDLAIPLKIEQQIDKILAGDSKGNVRLLSNYIITFFNVFEYRAARNILYFLAKPEYHIAIRTVMIHLGRADQDEYADFIECREIKQLLLKEFNETV